MSPRVGAEALLTRAAVVPKPRIATWRVGGRDAQAFLHRLLTQDVKSLTPGRARWSCFLTVKGKVLGDPVVWNLGDDFALTLDADAAAKTIPPLERYVIADDVTFTDVSGERSNLVVAGPRAPGLLEGIGLAPPEGGTFLHAAVGGVRATVLRRDLGSVPAFEMNAPSVGVSGVFDALVRGGAVVATDEDWDVLRVETGTPAYGAEIDERILPNEAGLDAAVSFTKGCYLGQEPVVMAKHRGRPPTRLVRLTIDGTEVPARDAALLGAGAGGARVGRLSTAVTGVTKPGVIALGFVKYELAVAGASFAVDPGGRRAVVEAVLA